MENLALASLTLVPIKQLAKKKLINTKFNTFYFMLKVLIRSSSAGQNLRYGEGFMCLQVCAQKGREKSNRIRINIKIFVSFLLIRILL